MASDWTPDQPLRSGGTESEVRRRVEYLTFRKGHSLDRAAYMAADEFAAAQTAALRKENERLSADRDALVPLACVAAYGIWPLDVVLDRGIAVLRRLGVGDDQ